MIIYKYPLKLGVTELQVPYSCKVLSVQMQGDTPTLWAMVDPEGLPRSLKVHCIGTGQEVPKHTFHIGTVQDGAYVWHFFVEGWL